MGKLTKYGKIGVDCDDTGIFFLERLMKKGFDPRMMYANYYLVPPGGDLTGVTGDSELGGHFVATADIYDDIPKAMEQLPYVRTQKEVEDDDGYYCVGFQRMDRDLRAQWYYTDKDGYDLLYDGDIDILEAKARPQYQEHIAYLNKVHSHDVMDKPEIRPTCGNKFDFFRQRADEMYEHNEEVYEKYFEAKEVVVAGRVNKSKHTIPPDFNSKKKELQMFLRDLDLYHGGIDGIFGKKSNEAYQEALDEFQFTKDDMMLYVDDYIDMPSSIGQSPRIEGNYELESRSIKELKGVHPDLVKSFVKELTSRTPIPFTVIDGIRTMDEQIKLVARGS